MIATAPTGTSGASRSRSLSHRNRRTPLRLRHLNPYHSRHPIHRLNPFRNRRQTRLPPPPTGTG